MLAYDTVKERYLIEFKEVGIHPKYLYWAPVDQVCDGQMKRYFDRTHTLNGDGNVTR